MASGITQRSRKGVVGRISDDPGRFAMSFDEIRQEIERKYGWKISRQRVGQIIDAAHKKILKALAGTGFESDTIDGTHDETQENQSLEAVENHPVAGAADSLPGQN